MKKISITLASIFFASTCFAGENWVYKDKVDEMRGITETYAVATSENTHSWQAPWGQDSALSLIVWKGQLNKYTGKTPEVEAYALVLNSMISCSDVRCYGSVKFDDGPIYEVFISGTPGNKVRFMGSSGGNFNEDLINSKKVVIELPFYNSGRSQFKVDISGLDLEKIK